MSEPYRIRSPETWEAARLAYLDGFSAEEVCGRFDLGLSALRKRARAKGWRRVDQAEVEPLDDDDADDLPDMDDQALADLARRRMGVAARRGRVAEALRWARLRDVALRPMRDRRRLDRDDLERIPPGPPSAAQADLEVRAPDPPPRERALAILARARAELQEVQEVQQVHANSPFAPGLNRTERRRRLKRMKRQTGPP